MFKPIATLAAAALLLSACSSDTSETETTGTSAGTTVSGDIADKYDLSGQSVTDLITEMDTVSKEDRIQSLHASVKPNELVLTDLDTEATESIAIPDDQFYLSFSPYLAQTHECYFHSLTTCTGELQNVAMDVKITDDDGDAVVDKTLTSGDNGFIGVWIPKGIEVGNLEVNYNGKSVSLPISTDSEDDPTCLTSPVRLS